jgi:hypothetical protein
MRGYHVECLKPELLFPKGVGIATPTAFMNIWILLKVLKSAYIYNVSQLYLLLKKGALSIKWQYA